MSERADATISSVFILSVGCLVAMSYSSASFGCTSSLPQPAQYEDLHLGSILKSTALDNIFDVTSYYKHRGKGKGSGQVEGEAQNFTIIITIRICASFIQWWLH